MADSHASNESHEHADPLMSYLMVFGALIVLLLLTVGAYHVPFEKMFGEEWGFLNTALALVIASIKTSLVVLFFMHLRHGTKLTWVIASTGFVWLCIMITFFYADYLSRSAIPEIVHGSDSDNVKLTIPESVHHEPKPFNGVG